MTSSSSVTVGIHLPQAGPAASGEALRQAAVLAEQLGFRDVWLSDHLLVPTGVDYPPSAYVFEPLASMAWVAAVTNTVRIGTSILVLPMRHPIEVAKSLATIDQFSGGRVVLGTAAGWLEAEFDALGVPFNDRGARMDEALEMLRTMWTEDHITRTFPVHGAQIHIDAGQASAGDSSAHLDWWAWKGRHPKSDQRRRWVAWCFSRARADEADRLEAAPRSPRSGLRHFDADDLGSDGGQPRPDSRRVRCLS